MQHNDLISRQSLLEKVQYRIDTPGIIGATVRDMVATTRRIIAEEPTVDVAQMVHGQWVFEPIEFTYEKDIKCSVCGEYVDHATNYCPNCGAKMDLKGETMELKVKLDPGAKMPTLAHENDAGYDLYSREYRCIYPGCRYSFDTGVHVAIPEGYFGKIESKSGLNAKHGLTCTGVIDSGYTGSIAVILHNGGRDVVQIKHGQKIGQLLIQPVEHPKLVQVEELEDTERGSGGFGSSGEF